MERLSFKEVWCADFEFGADDGERPVVRCLVATEVRTGRTIRQWLDRVPVPAAAPFNTGPDALFVSFFASAEMGCFRVLDWLMPAHVLDLYAEFKWLSCGRDGFPGKPCLLYALDHFGLPSMDATDKTDMRNLALRGGPYTADEQAAILDYCESDVVALVALLSKMLPHVDMPRAILRGRFVKAVAEMEYNGIPIDVPILARLDEHWESLQLDMVRAVDADYGVYDGIHFRTERFARWLARRHIPWPRLISGDLELTDEVFKEMVVSYPALAPLVQLRQMMDILRLADLPVGRDGRNRCLLSPFGTITGRCAPSTSGFIFGRAAWMRSLIRPEEGQALAYIDWSSQEYGIGAVLSGDPEMIADYERGDPYLGFAKRIGMVPQEGTKHTHRPERDVVKQLILGTQYGMGEQSLAVRFNKPVVYARDLLRLHRQTYRKFWEWSDAAVNLALFTGRLWTRFGWQVWTKADPNPRSLANFPCQANGAEMLRLAAVNVVNSGTMLNTTIHDALLIEAPARDIDAAIAIAQDGMGRASEAVLSGLRLHTDTKIVVAPNRYRDDRGAEFFDEMVRRLDARTAARPRRTVIYW
ncbi:MAG TPA: DNA polymerase [Gemmataceae bacterium]|nr:DNA polymerase [Gemmataceae bacterium]